MGAVLDKVVTPDMIGIPRPQPDARTIVEPEPPLLRLLLWHFEPLPPPDPLNPLPVHLPPGLPQQSGDAPVAITAVLESQSDDVSGQSRFVIRGGGDLALGGTVLAKSSADPSLGQAQFGPDVPPRRHGGGRGFLGGALLRPFAVIGLHPAVLGAPAVVRDLRHANRADRLSHGPALGR